MNYKSRFATFVVLIVFGIPVFSPLSAAQETRQARPVPPFKIIRKSGDALQMSAIRQVEAVYPEAAREAKVSGPVVVELFIDPLGNVHGHRPYPVRQCFTVQWMPRADGSGNRLVRMESRSTYAVQSPLSFN